MAYSATSGVEIAVGGAARLLALADLDANGVADAGVVDAAISEADSIIDSYASKRFLVPFAAPTVAIATLSARMAARILRRNRQMTLAADVEEEKRDREWLAHLASGLVLPGVDPLPAKGSIVVDKVGERDSSRDVSRERTKGLW